MRKGSFCLHNMSRSPCGSFANVLVCYILTNLILPFLRLLARSGFSGDPYMIFWNFYFELCVLSRFYEQYRVNYVFTYKVFDFL